jgi:VanZ family protein
MTPDAPRHKSSAVPLALLYAGLIVYASLYPFTGWRLPGVPVFSFLALPLPPYWTAFDLGANLVGYVPLGALLFIALVRSECRPGLAWGSAVLMGGLLSLTLELLQNFLPQRVPSNVDLGLNAAGGLVGASMGALVHAMGWVDRWQMVRERWFAPRSAGGLALFLLWPMGLLFPLPVPFGMGQVLDRARDSAMRLLEDTFAADWVSPWLPSIQPVGALAPGGEFMTIALGLLAPCLVAFAVSHPGWRRGVLVLGVVGMGLATTTLSFALSFGPQHALAWMTPVATNAVLAALVLALALAWLSRRAVAALGLMVLTALVALVSQAPADPYFAESLQAWEQGRFIRFHGAAQWVGWFWPYAAMAHLMSVVAGRYGR